jgi:peroxiredoxin
MPHNPLDLPANLPVPVDDGACDHLSGMRLPSISLMSTSEQMVDLAGLRGRTVVYCYPRTGRPDQEVPKGWDEIPGARGCTPQSCAFRDHYAGFEALGARVFGLSTQTAEYQREAVTRLHLPFALLSDMDLIFARALRLPTFEFAWSFGAQPAELIKRLTLVAQRRPHRTRLLSGLSAAQGRRTGPSVAHTASALGLAPIGRVPSLTPEASA